MKALIGLLTSFHHMIGIILASFFCLTTSVSFAQDASQTTGTTVSGPTNTSSTMVQEEGLQLTLQDRIKAVSRKPFLKAQRFEIEPFMGATINDAYFRRYFAGGRFAYHVHDAWAIDAGFAATLFTETQPSVRILREQAFLVNDDAKLVAMADIGMTFSPVYGKFAVLNRYIILFDGFVSGGIGAAIDTNQSLLHPLGYVGLGMRIALAEWLMFRLDWREALYQQERAGISTIQNIMSLNAGLSVFIPFGFTYKNEGARLVE